MSTSDHCPYVDTHTHTHVHRHMHAHVHEQVHQHTQTHRHAKHPLETNSCLWSDWTDGWLCEWTIKQLSPSMFQG